MSNYTFDGSEGGTISEATAKEYLGNYEQSQVFPLNNGVKAHFFGKDIINDLLAQSGAMGIRIYYGRQSTFTGYVPELILVATDANGDDILANDLIADISRPCPDFCADTGLKP